jgi:betaine reductase
MDLKGKRVLVIGERDGVSGTAIESCVRSAGADVVYVETQCFV